MKTITNVRSILVTLVPALLSTLPVAAQSQNPHDPNPGIVLTPSSAPGGLTYGEWSARWFKWAYEPPPALSPVLDLTGANCAVGQSGDVWFLAGPLFPLGTPVVTRTCTIPAGKMLFFPVGNAFSSAEPDYPDTFANQRKNATKAARDLRNFSADLDLFPINGLHSELEANYYRALSPEFAFVFGAPNIFGVVAGVYSPAAADGVYLMLAPLAPGTHILRFRADLKGGGQIQATYTLTVL